MAVMALFGWLQIFFQAGRLGGKYSKVLGTFIIIDGAVK